MAQIDDEAKPKPIAPCTRDFSCALGLGVGLHVYKLHVMFSNSDLFIALFSPAVIGCSNHFGIVFLQVI